MLAFCYLLRGLKLDFQLGYRASWPMVSVVILSPYRIRFVYFSMYVKLKFHTHDSELPCDQSVNAMQLLKNRVSIAIRSCAEAWKLGELVREIQFLRYWTCIPSLQKKTAFQLYLGQQSQFLCTSQQTICLHATEVCIVTAQRLDLREITVNFLEVVRILCLLQWVQTRFGAHPSSYAVGIGVALSGCEGKGVWSSQHVSIYCWV